MELSRRLQAVANLISEHVTVADIGCDHGYIPIYLLQTRKSPKVLALDVNEGPLKRAKEHIAVHGLSIDTRLSDGVKELSPGEVECVVIAGMGGALTIRIMEDGELVFRNLKEFILQPQSEIYKVRQYLCMKGYRIIEEDMVLEDGKFYPMMKVINGTAPKYNNLELSYGPLLLEQKHPVLKTFLEKEKQKRSKIKETIVKEAGEHNKTRIREIESELEEIEYALQRYY